MEQALRKQSFRRATGWIGQKDSMETGPGLGCGTGVGYGEAVGTAGISINFLLTRIYFMGHHSTRLKRPEAAL